MAQKDERLIFGKPFVYFQGCFGSIQRCFIWDANCSSQVLVGSNRQVPPSGHSVYWVGEDLNIPQDPCKVSLPTFG